MRTYSLWQRHRLRVANTENTLEVHLHKRSLAYSALRFTDVGTEIVKSKQRLQHPKPPLQQTSITVLLGYYMTISIASVRFNAFRDVPIMYLSDFIVEVILFPLEILRSA